MPIAYLCRVWHRHPWWLWKDLSTCCCSWRVSSCSLIVSFHSLFHAFLCSLFKNTHPFVLMSIWYTFFYWMFLAVFLKQSGNSCALDYNRLVCQQNTTVKAVSPTRNLECLNLLLNIGADFNRKDNFGRWDKCVTGILNKIRSEDRAKCSAIFWEAEGKYEVLTGIKNTWYWLFYHPRTPLHYASANCNYQCVFALVGSGASINELDQRGCSPLHYAAAADTDGK